MVRPAGTLDDWIDPLEQTLREGVQSYLLELEAVGALGRLRYGRQDGAKGYRNAHRSRELMSTMGRMMVAVPRARVTAGDGTRREFKSALLPKYRRLTTPALALIAGAYLAGVNTRRVHRAGRLVRRHGEQGHGQSCVAQGAGGLHDLESAGSIR